MAAIKTAPEVVQSTVKLQDKLTAEQRQHNKAVDVERERLEYYGDLRDDVVSLVRNSNLTFEEIHGRLGPHPSTLTKWDEKTTRAPQFRKLQATCRILGYDIGITDGPRRPAVRKVVPLP
jgi:hypothetical protein